MAARQNPPSPVFSSSGPRLLAGADEAGRGCLAGPVVAAAVILPQSFDLPGLTDSKLLTPRRRQNLALAIQECALTWGLGVIWPQRIARINILQASLEAMARAASFLKLSPEILLIDGNKPIPEHVLAQFWKKRHTNAPPSQKAIIRGDALVPAISAASILAKTFRDKLMVALARVWPGYGFERHKGYGVKEHFLALKKLGPCKLHRPGFKGVDGRSLLE